MRAAYVDTSCLIAIAFGEPGFPELADRLVEFDVLIASNVLEAELRAALATEQAPTDTSLLNAITWVTPDRVLSREITTVLSAGQLRGASLWHLACALFVSESPRELSFLTLDKRQEAVARKLGFPA